MMAWSPSRSNRRPDYARLRQKRAASRVLVAEAAIAAFASALAADAAVGITSQRRTEMPRVLIDYKSTIYTVDRAVGRNAPNDRLDVLLVQFLLFFSIKKTIGGGAPVLPRLPRSHGGCAWQPPYSGRRHHLSQPTQSRKEISLSTAFAVTRPSVSLSTSRSRCS